MRSRAYLLLIGLASCDPDARNAASGLRDEVQLSPALPASSAPVEKLPAMPEERDVGVGETCADEWKRIEGLPELPGAPEFEARRSEILARARSRPVVFRRAPGSRRAEDAAQSAHTADGKEPKTPFEADVQAAVAYQNALAKKLRKKLENARYTAPTLGEIFTKTRRNHELRRAVLLTEGYLYSERPALAARLAQSVRLEHLYEAPRLILERGAETFVAVRKKDTYVYEGGELDGEPAQILLLDRVRLSDEPARPPLHFDVRAVAEALGANSLQIRRITEAGILLEPSYGGIQTQAVATLDGPRATLKCEIVPDEVGDLVARARDWNVRRQKAFAPLKKSIDAMVAEALPFDEPKTEEGQQDGKLRPEWRKAYRRGKRRYEFNGDKYAVFDWKGRPRVPQVCIDFITDAFERASGAWWPERGKGRHRSPGTLNFRRYGIENPRSIESLAFFAEDTPEWFDFVWLDKSERIKFRKRREFFEHLAGNSARYQVGDVIFIYGLRDDEKHHYHSFFIYEADPVTGAPTAVAANAGQPRIRSWEAEMSNAPRRFIVARLRPRLPFLERAFAGKEALAPPLRANRDAAGSAASEGGGANAVELAAASR